MNQRAPALITAKASSAAMCVSSGAGGRDQSQRQMPSAASRPSQLLAWLNIVSHGLLCVGLVLLDSVLEMLPLYLALALLLLGLQAFRQADIASALLLIALAPCAVTVKIKSNITHQCMAPFYRWLQLWASLRSLSRAGGGPAPKTRRLPAAAPAPCPQTQTPKESV